MTGAPKQTLRGEHVERTRRAVVVAARRLFGKGGFAATTIDEIAVAARVTKGAVYHHFTNKEELFRVVYDEVEGEVEWRTALAGADAPDPITQLIRGVESYLDASLEAEVQRITLLDAPSVLGAEPNGPTEDQPGHVGTRAFIAAAISEGQMRDVDPDALTHLIRGACLQAGTLIARSDDPEGTRDRLGATLHQLIVGLEVPIARQS